jgi:Uncharacterized protein conserved in bacteria (DUF2188)
MARLPRYTLDYNERSERWTLENAAGKAVKSFKTKAAATRGGALRRAIGGEGSVRIQKANARFQEERTFPPE